MSKLRLTVIIFAIGLSATASAQRLTTDQRAACRPDFEKLCGDIKPGGGRIMECLSSKMISSATTARKWWIRGRNNSAYPRGAAAELWAVVSGALVAGASILTSSVFAWSLFASSDFVSSALAWSLFASSAPPL
jgi:Cysteine rich repeat